MYIERNEEGFTLRLLVQTHHRNVEGLALRRWCKPNLDNRIP